MLNQLYQEAFRPTISQISQLKKENLPYLITGLGGGVNSILIAQTYANTKQSMLVVTSSQKELANLYDDLTSMVAEDELFIYPGEPNYAIEFATSSLDITAERVEALNHLISGKPGIVLTNGAGLRQRLTPLADWKSNTIDLEVGREYELSQLEENFVNMGYQRVGMVIAPGEFSVRGGIVDFYPLTGEHPIRLDFFDVELDSMRYFDADSQESIENIEKLQLTPAKEIIFPLDQQEKITPQLQADLDQAIAKLESGEASDNLKTRMNEHIQVSQKGGKLHLAEAYLAYHDPQGTNLLDYLPDEGYLWLLDYGQIQQRSNQQDEENQFWLEQEINRGDLIPGTQISLPLDQSIGKRPVKTIYLSLTQRGLVDIRFSGSDHIQYRPMNPFYNQFEFLKSELKNWQEKDWIIQLVIKNPRRVSSLVEKLEEIDIKPVTIQDPDQEPFSNAINIVQGYLHEGFELVGSKWVIITEKELFESISKNRPRKRRSNLSNAERIKSYNELEVGDYVVHANHGIGQYKGIEAIEIGDAHRDLMVIEYEEGAKLMVPVDQIDLIQKYSVSDGYVPKVHNLGSNKWAKTKQKVASSVEDIADELIEIYAKRESSKGYAFSKDTPEQKEFEASFPYVETPDQLQSIEEIKADMEKDRPMDRLLVGDVGYGKTEVAMRAIFKAVMDGKQAAFLAPTTVLAQQHYNTLRDRFRDWPFEIRLLSRFVKPSQQKQTIEDLKIGKVSILIGTHRMLSDDVKFNDLGLLVIDEEQRFGVRHKEKIKKMKSEVDVLTLTATPIPRTLHMSMIGIRDLSVIETPPSNRFPVQTYVIEQNGATIKSAIDRELARDGQIFYVYNRVESIHQKAAQIQALVPDASIGVAHGQMSEVEMENTLMDFINGEYDILVTTTIIETGVDVPNVNTLFIENADRFGLGQLYQLRGRVGRSHRIAFAYLMYQPDKQLSEVSQNRLNAISEFTELGSGFKIAMRDLSIRGAGNILGQQQSGFIDSVGYDMYSSMLAEAVDRKLGRAKKKSAIQAQQLDWGINVDAYLPSEYIGDEDQKIGVYKLINQIETLEDYRDVQDQLIDRFGEYPDSVSNLLDISLIRSRSFNVGVESFKQKKNQVWVTFTEAASKIIKGPEIFQALQNVPTKADIQLRDDKMEVGLDIAGKEVDQWLGYLIEFTKGLDEIINKGDGEDED